VRDARFRQEDGEKTQSNEGTMQLRARGSRTSKLRSRSEVPVLARRGEKRREARPHAGPTWGMRKLAKGEEKEKRPHSARC
jgi:hypothetical protein